MTALVGGIEAGGTKFVCALGTGPDDLRAETRIPTTSPIETITRSIEFFAEASGNEMLAAIGIASFGPLDPDPRSATYGHITSTPKAGWTHTDLAGEVARRLRVPVAFDTDVNGAALGESLWGAATSLDTFAYLTVGTGIGGGAMVSGQLLHGMMHPEMGHILLPRRHDDHFPGVCRFHGTCLEGMASGPALARRWGQEAEDLPDDHPAWELEAHYLALGLTNIICTLSPQRIILGGGVMNRRQLYPLIRRKVLALLNGYIRTPVLMQDLEGFIVPPALGHRSGVLGALALAQRATDSVSLPPPHQP